MHIAIGNHPRNTCNIKSFIIQLTYFLSFLSVATAASIPRLLSKLVDRILLAEREVFNHGTLHAHQIEAQHVFQIIQNDHHEYLLQEVADTFEVVQARFVVLGLLHLLLV